MAGRYKGRRNGVTRQWQPTKWIPKYDVIIALYCGGAKQGVIATVSKMTPAQVNSIINSEDGKLKVRDFQVRQQARLESSMEERIESMQAKALDNVHRVINDEGLINSDPFSVFDRSLAYLRGTGKLIADKRPEESTIAKSVTQNNFFIQNPEVAERVADGLNKVLEVNQLPNSISNSKK